MFFKQLENNLSVREVDADELNKYLDLHFASTFNNRVFDYQSFPIDEASKNKMNLRKNASIRYQLRLAMFNGSDFVGWHFGHEVDSETYYMQNSAVLEKYRGQGFYTKLLDVILERIAAEGFQVVTSTHHPHNAAVLIPKLKKGFFISGMQFNERFRSLIELKLIFNEDRRKNYFKNLGLTL